MLHYTRMTRQNGPLIKVSSLRFESKHREVKIIVQNSCNRKNILMTIGTRYQLAIMHLVRSQYKDMYVTYGHELTDNLISDYFQIKSNKKSLKSVRINDGTYASGTIIATEITEYGVQYGEIDKVYSVYSDIYFRYIPLESIGFNSHYFATSVLNKINDRNIVNYKKLVTRTPCLMYKKNGLFIVTRHVL